MELKRWFISQPEVDFTVPDYDSTKAALGELEQSMKEIRRQLNRNTLNHGDRLTALEARAHNNRALIGKLAARVGIPEDLGGGI